MQQKCRVCLILKNNTEFLNGRHICKICRNAQQREYRKKNKDKINKEARTKYNKEYYKKNKEQILEYREIHKIEIQKQVVEDKKNNPEKYLFKYAKHRAKKYSIPFNIDVFDIIIPQICPVLGIPLFRNFKYPGPNSPTVDRINNNLGYIKGNICVISHRANQLKRDATPEEIYKIASYIKTMENKNEDIR